MIARTARLEEYDWVLPPYVKIYHQEKSSYDIKCKTDEEAIIVKNRLVIALEELKNE